VIVENKDHKDQLVLKVILDLKVFLDSKALVENKALRASPAN
jgi:hypothetical protein